MNAIPLSFRFSRPPTQLPNQALHRHQVQFYLSDEFLLEVASRFIGQAIAAGDATIVVATKTHWDGITQCLEARGIDIAEQIQSGRSVFVDAEKLLSRITVDGRVDGIGFTNTTKSVFAKIRGEEADGGSQVAVFGELVALLWTQGRLREAIQVEELWNQLAQSEPFYLLCAYPLAEFDRDTHIAPFLEVCTQHSQVFPSETYLRLTSREDCLRSIACLQQKAQVLDSEMALRRSEQLFRLFVDAVEDYAIFTLDSEGHICSWNAGAERIQGYNAAEILGKHVSCFYPEGDVQCGMPKADLETAARVGRFEVEAWRVRKDGSIFWANVVITPVKDEAGRVIGFGKVTRDFTERMKTQGALQKEIVERRKAEQRLRGSEKSLRQLSLHLLRTQDEERRRIGRNLHDSLGQSLAVLKMKLESLNEFGEGPGQQVAEDIAQCIGLVEDSIVELRTISYLLYPPMLEEMGLKSAIPWYLDGFAARSGIATTFQIDTKLQRFPGDVELALFRVLQECLTNVHKHSKGKAVEIRLLMKDGCAVLEVKDNGTGVSPEAGERFDQGLTGRRGVGLRGMNERMRELGGTFELISTRQGTTVIATAPVEPPASAARPAV
jgi:PAS domain S-box-containing protein